MKVRVGGRTHGPSKSHKINLKPDTYEVHLTSDEVFLDLKSQISVASNEQASLDAPAAVAVRVAAQPGNCRVFINTRLIGESPFTQSLVAGTYDFRFEWPGGESRSYSETISGQNSEVFGTPD